MHEDEHISNTHTRRVMTWSIILNMEGVGGGGFGTEGDLAHVFTCVGCHREVIYHGSVTQRDYGLSAVMIKCCFIQVRYQDNCIQCKSRQVVIYRVMWI